MLDFFILKYIKEYFYNAMLEIENNQATEIIVFLSLIRRAEGKEETFMKNKELYWFEIKECYWLEQNLSVNQRTPIG